MGDFDPAAFDAFERASWEHVAHAYLDGFAMLSAHTVDPLLEAVGARDGLRLLDVGCGPGVLSRRAAARGCRVTGVDVAAPMIEIARSSLPEASFVLADVQTGLPYADASFEAVAGNMVVHHFSRPPLALAHLVRVLRPGGRLGLTMWDPPADNPALGIFNDAVEAAGAGQPAGIPVLPDRPDDSSFGRLYADAGLRDIAVTHVRFEFVTEAARWWDAVTSSTALTAAVVTRQPVDTQQQIRAAYDELVQEYVDQRGQARFPTSATLAVGTR